MKRDTWPVLPDQTRNGGPKSHCQFCKAQVGQEHAATCVCRKRTMVLALTINLVTTMPEFWDEKTIDFHVNESSSCADNRLTEVNELCERLAEQQERIGVGCLCGIITGKYLREATAKDEEEQVLKVGELKS